MISNLSVLAHGITTTLIVTAYAFGFGLLVAVPVTAGRMSRLWPVSSVATLYIEVFRGVPPLVWLFIIFYGLPRDAIHLSTLQTATVGLGLVATAYIAEIYRTAIKSVRRGQWEAAHSLGLGGVQTFGRVILPQAVIVAVPSAVTYLIGLLKDSSVASVIGTRDITALARSQSNFSGIGVFFDAAIFYIALSIPIAIVARWTGSIATRYLTR